ncbi:uncharacterized protein LOC125675769 isoform X2 [Ostrea edulis]|uniref:uncharacterized protein LOC125675769 isoform X2 n=1 Tax=Ostrea edulis TaxID=37623 RepID=UPI0024AFE23E|nr:uncharacterized protein LOC125675769 isoform X2 [Ostrea edulis]
MAAAIPASPSTPRRIYSLCNICCLCGFSFLIKEVDRNGTVTWKKLSKLKLRLTDEKRDTIQKIIEMPPHSEGVCVKCFAKVEKIIKYKKEIDNIISVFRESRRRFKAKTPSSSTRKKRVLRSPQVCLPEFKHVCKDPERTSEMTIPIIPQPTELLKDSLSMQNKGVLEEGIVTSLQIHAKEFGVCVDKQKPKPRSKRSLQFSTVTSPLQGSVEVDRIFIVMF